MVRKKMEGDEEQRRRAAREAERMGSAPSARGETTGASKQRTHVPDRSSLTHQERVAPLHRGKQRQPDAEEEYPGPPVPPTGPEFPGRDVSGYTDRHERVFRALAETERQRSGEPVALEDIAPAAGLPRDEVRALLHDLVTVHRLVTELPQPGADQGYRFEVKSRL